MNGTPTWGDTTDPFGLQAGVPNDGVLPDDSLPYKTTAIYAALF
jgi:hypothetical protein